MWNVEVWPGPAPGDHGAVDAEGFRPAPPGATPDTKWLTNVSQPTISVYPPTPDLNTGAAMLICPGGGYWNLGWDVEGEEVAAWLNTIGVTGVLLKYRVPRRAGAPKELPPSGPLLDAQRALSLVRSQAKAWDIEPNRIGMIGFSAGAHLALATATNFDQRAYQPLDDIDAVSCRPDFVVSLYPGYLVVPGTQLLAPYMRIPALTPPVFLVHAADDPISAADNSVVIHLALTRAGVSSELHVYTAGGHGFGVRQSDHPVSTWPARCAEWLRHLGLLGSRTG